MSDVVSISCVGDGGEAGGVSTTPGEQVGRCLFGTRAGVPRCDVFIDSCGGGVAVRLDIAACLVVHTVAITSVLITNSYDLGVNGSVEMLSFE